MTKKHVGGRPTLAQQGREKIEVRVCLALYRGEDDDLIDWFDSIPYRKKSKFVKTALRAGGMTVEINDSTFETIISDDFLDELLGGL